MSGLYSTSQVQWKVTRLYAQQYIHCISSLSLFSVPVLSARPSRIWLREVLTTALIHHRATVQWNGWNETSEYPSRYGVLSVNMFVPYFQFENDFLSGEMLLINAIISLNNLNVVFNAQSCESQLLCLEDSSGTFRRCAFFWSTF